LNTVSLEFRLVWVAEDVMLGLCRLACQQLRLARSFAAARAIAGYRSVHETWHALDLLAKDSMRDFRDLVDEAFADLLRKHGRPVDLKTALRQSVRGSWSDRRCRPALTP
jgi:hypothetical protein